MDVPSQLKAMARPQTQHDPFSGRIYPAPASPAPKRKLLADGITVSPALMGPPSVLPRSLSTDRQGSLPPFPPATPQRQPSLPPPIKSASSLVAPLAPPPPLPTNVNLNPNITRVQQVPLITSTQSIPPLDEDEIHNVQQWLEKDKAYDALLRAQKDRAKDELRSVFAGPSSSAPQGGSALGWWEKPGNSNLNKWRRPRENFEVRFPRTKRERDAMIRTRKGTRRQGLKLPRTIDAEDANRPEMLVPIRIEFDVDHHKMRDTFVWNLNDPVITPEIFAQSLIEDYAISSNYHSLIVKSIQDQLSDYKSHLLGFDLDSGQFIDAFVDQSHASPVMKGYLEGDEAEWWSKWRTRLNDEIVPNAVKQSRHLVRQQESSKKPRNKRKRPLKQEDDVDMAGDEMDDLDDRPLSVDEFKFDENNFHEEMRILIKLDIIVASVKLDDQFEWDLDNPAASPEEFAQVYTQELGLGGEFKTAIAHAIREQVQTYQKSLFLVGHLSDGSAVQDEDLKQSFLPSLISGARPVNEVGSFTPLLNYLSDGELERTEKERDKDMNKRRKRNTRGRRGIALPDREPIRTYRTPAIGFPELDPATLALAAAANAPTSRRAAAAAASLTIANMVASENGTPFIPQTLSSMSASQHQQVPLSLPKEKKPKGLFKAPVYPPSVLRPRAGVAAPTPSTAADTSASTVAPDNEAPRSSSTQPALLPADNRNSRIITAKRAKELEREAKEKEFVDGQHPNYIDGVWHCSNCGCPESIAIGRRKGPLGDKSQCGTCGKFWHRHRRPRPVEYNSDPNFHSGLKQKETEGSSKTPLTKKKGAAALRAQSTAAHSTPAPDQSAPQTPARNGNANGGGDTHHSSSKYSSKKEKEKERQQKDDDDDDDDRAMSPVSTASSASETPLAQTVKLNGGHSKSASVAAVDKVPVTPAKSESTPAPAAKTEATPAPSASATTGTSTAAVTATNTPPSPNRTWPPQWLTSAMQAMQAKYPDDRFEAILRRVNPNAAPEWRIKCLDCPGKLYTPGPNETLANYDVHLKNRQHRQRVNERTAAARAAAGGASGS